MTPILGIDPGQQGALVLILDGELYGYRMPIIAKTKEVHFETLRKILCDIPRNTHIFLERAVPLAMGSKHAFNYGRGFAAIEIAIKLSSLTVTYVEPSKWTKVMHEGINADLKPKAKSKIAFERLFPSKQSFVPKGKTGKPHEGLLEALLIAAYGQRQIK